jgi:YajG family uncharacterized lipoprotein
VSRRATAGVICCITLLAVAACARRTVDVGYQESVANRALLSSVAPRRVVVAPVTDRRAERSRIGIEMAKGKPIVTARPVPDIVRDALVVELRKNGHEVVAGPGDVVVSADVEEFWLDAVGRTAKTQYVGRVAIAVAIADGQSGDALMTRRYVGIRRRSGEADSKETWREVMETALARTIHDVATDPDLAFNIGRAPR